MAITRGGIIGAAGLLVAGSGYAAQIAAYIIKPEPKSTAASAGVAAVVDSLPIGDIAKEAVGAAAGQVVPMIIDNFEDRSDKK